MDGQDTHVKREITVCLIPVLITAHVQIQINHFNVCVPINGMVNFVLNMTFVVHILVRMEGFVKILTPLLNVIVQRDGQGRLVKHKIIVMIRGV